VRLLVVAPHLEPDSAPTGVVVSAIVRELATLGHDVHVVTSMPWYADHRVDEAWRAEGKGRLVRQDDQADATVTRCHPFPTAKTNLVGRALGFVGFSGLATLAAVGRRGPFDAVVAVSPPLTLGLTGWLAARRHRCPLVFNIQDVFPDVAVEVGAIRSRRLIGLFSRLERFCYRRSAAVTVLSDDLAANVQAKLAGGRRSPRVEVIPNFTDTGRIRPADRATAYRAEHGLGDRTVVMYAGNLGHSQSLDLVVAAARRHADRDDVAYVVNGGGVAAGAMAEAAADLPNLTLVGFQPAERLSEVLASGDIHVVPLRRGLGASSVPSKTYAILAAGRPVVASVDEGTEVACTVAEAGAGLAVPPDDPEAFISAIETLLDDADGRARMGAAGRTWAEQWRSAGSVAAAYAALIDELT